VNLKHTDCLSSIQQETKHLMAQKVLRAEEVAVLDLEAIAAFWNSSLGTRIRDRAQFVQRELAFTARFTPRELAEITGEELDTGFEEDFVVVQGVADLAVVMAGEVWVVDFKTDSIEAAGVAERATTYWPQLKVYSRALSKIHKKPVTEAWLHFFRCNRAVVLEQT
jgi:ATP-dependent helicase/nuclease subunit A